MKGVLIGRGSGENKKPQLPLAQHGPTPGGPEKKRRRRGITGPETLPQVPHTLHACTPGVHTHTHTHARTQRVQAWGPGSEEAGGQEAIETGELIISVKVTWRLSHQQDLELCGPLHAIGRAGQGLQRHGVGGGGSPGLADSGPWRPTADPADPTRHDQALRPAGCRRAPPPAPLCSSCAPRLQGPSPAGAGCSSGRRPQDPHCFLRDPSINSQSPPRAGPGNGFLSRN